MPDFSPAARRIALRLRIRKLPAERGLVTFGAFNDVELIVKPRGNLELSEEDLIPPAQGSKCGEIGAVERARVAESGNEPEVSANSSRP